MTAETKMGKRINLNLYLESNKGLLEEAVLKYYQQLQKNKGKNKEYLTAAILGYWEAMAYWDLGLNGDEKEQQLKPLHNLHRLRQQINYLQDRFDLDYNPSSVGKLMKLDRETLETSTKSVEFEYRYQVSEDTPEGQVAKWLSQSKSKGSVMEKVMWASVGYWGAVACSELELLSNIQLQRCAMNCIYRISEQMDYLNNVLCTEGKVISPCSTSVPEKNELAHHQSSSSPNYSEEPKTEEKITRDYFLDPERWKDDIEFL